MASARNVESIDVILVKRLTAAIERLNPSIPAEARGDALRKLMATEMPALVAENRRLHKLMIEGVNVEFQGEDGSIRGDKVRLIDFDDHSANDWLATGQFPVINGGINRRPDIVVFVNGLPLGVIELKAPGGENATLTSAHNQLQTYKTQISALFRTNAVLIISDGLSARVGSLTADQERFMPWRTTDGKEIAAKGKPELAILFGSVYVRRNSGKGRRTNYRKDEQSFAKALRVVTIEWRRRFSLQMHAIHGRPRRRLSGKAGC
jgi:type I restriction enzyme R subunit